MSFIDSNSSSLTNRFLLTYGLFWMNFNPQPFDLSIGALKPCSEDGILYLPLSLQHLNSPVPSPDRNG